MIIRSSGKPNKELLTKIAPRLEQIARKYGLTAIFLKKLIKNNYIRDHDFRKHGMGIVIRSCFKT